MFTPSLFRLSPAAMLAGFSLVGAAPAQAADSPLPDLATYRWQARVLVVDAPAQQDPRYAEQAAEWLARWHGLQERDLTIISRFGGDDFRVRLVGKDGGVKVDQTELLTAKDLFAIIDAMPMRRREIRERSGPSAR